MRTLVTAAVVATVLSTALPTTDAGARATPKPTIVVVHGAFADASGFGAVTSRLQRRGYTVIAPANPLRGPSSDAAYVASVMKTIRGPIVLVAHSYGGFVITNAATGNANVKALVYIDSFMPDEGETLGGLAARSGSAIDESALNAVPSNGGVDLYLRWDANPPYPGYNEAFANGVEPETAATLFAAQRPAAADEFSEPSGTPAWKTIPSWSLIGTQDKVIPVALQEEMGKRAGAHVSRVKAGHLSLITRPADVTEVIVSAVAATI